MTYDLRRRLTLGATALALSLLPLQAQADTVTGVPFTKAADATEQGDGTMSTAARNAMLRGALPMNAAEVAAKAAATDASLGALGPASTSGADGSGNGALAAVFSGLNFVGQSDANVSPPDTTGAIGTTRYIQLVNRRFGIYNRTNGALISQGGLNTLTGLDSEIPPNVFDPQIMWDAQTNRFYYVTDAVFSSSDNRLAWGFSKTASPSNGTTDWCKYTTGFGTRFPDYPKLGDSFYFLIIGVNSFGPGFLGSDIISISKPPGGTTCPLASSFKVNRVINLIDSFTPVPSNQIDFSGTGYVVARNRSLPSNRLWFRNVTRNSSTGFAVYHARRQATVAAYGVPPDAPAGATGSRLLDTLDARPTNAVQSSNPDRRTFSFWTQHTINVGGVAGVRWYEINPVPNVPVILRQANISASPSHLFNAAISSDRRVRSGFSAAFGDSMVINYSVTRRGAGGINPRIVAGSSFSGGAVGGFIVLQNSLAAYVDFTCAGTTSTCRWGDYAGASPDPVIPVAANRGIVWGANQWGSGTSTAISNWRTKIFAVRP